MSPRRRESRDEDNSSFGSPEPTLEDLKPGVESGETRKREVAEGHHRRSPREGKKIPRESLAKRIRKAEKGG